LPLLNENEPLLVSDRASRVPPPPTVPEAIVIVLAPESVPLFQLKTVVTLREFVPVIWPPDRVSVETVTAVSRVTTCPPLTVAVSPDPGTPAPPQVVALLQLPDWLLL
jgi:hypothetical protein